MSFDQAILVWCVIVPALVAAGAAWAASMRERIFADAIAAVGWWLAVVAALIGCHGFRWWPEESWQQVMLPLLAWALLMSATASLGVCAWRWALAGVIACLTAMVAMPSGEAWSDVFDLYRNWIPLLAISCLVNGFAVENMAQRGASRWCLLVTVGGLLGPLVLAATTYGSLAQWGLAVVVATFAMSVVGLFRQNSRTWVVTFPAWAAATGVTASARCYTYEDHPVWLYGLILFSPTLIASIDLALNRRSERVRVIISAAASLLVVAAVTWKLLSS